MAILWYNKSKNFHFHILEIMFILFKLWIMCIMPNEKRADSKRRNKKIKTIKIE